MKNTIIYLLLALVVTFISCEEKEKDPKFDTVSVVALSASSYRANASVSEKGNITITDHGFVYYIGSGNPTYVAGTNNKISLGNKLSKDTFTTVINIDNNNYYSNDLKCFVWAYITNEKGTMYSEVGSAPILLLQASSIAPSNAKSGDTVTINGNNFNTDFNKTTVTFNNTQAKIVSATATKLRVIVPANISTSYYESYITVRVTTGNQTIQLSYNFSLSPSPTSFSPNHGTWGNSITIYGSGLSNCTVFFNDQEVSYYNSYNNYITVNVPSYFSYKTSKLYVSKNGVKTEVPGGVFTMDKLMVSSFSPQRCPAGATCTVYGSAFNSTTSYNKLHIGNLVVSASSYYSYNSYAQFTLPSTLSKGEYTAYVSNGLDTVVLPGKVVIVQPEITGILPTSGYPGTKFTISGHNLYYSNSYTNIYFDNTSFGYSSIDSTTIKGTVPYFDPGTYSVYTEVGGVRVKSPEKFTILAPTMSSISPATGIFGTSVVINGEGFGSSNNVSVYFGNIQATIMSISNTQINLKVPSGVTSGTWLVTVYVNNYKLSNAISFVVQ